MLFLNFKILYIQNSNLKHAVKEKKICVLFKECIKIYLIFYINPVEERTNPDT